MALPDEAERRLREIERALEAIAAGEETTVDLHGELDTAWRSAVSKAHDSAFATAAAPEVILAENVRRLRKTAGWTQERLAHAMTAAGFDWKRVTATDIERQVVLEDDENAQPVVRRLSLPEVVTLAGLFGVPVIELLLPTDGSPIDLPGGQVTSDEYIELVVGQGGSGGTGGPTWTPAARAVGTAAELRPAADYWRNQRSGEQHD